MAFGLSGNPLKCREFLRGLGTSSYNFGDVELSNSTHLTLQRELHFVVAYKLIVFHPLPPKLKMEQDMWYKHDQVFFVMYYQPLGSHPTVTRFLKQVFESKPTALGYTRPWDVSKVLCYLGTIYNSEDLSLWNVTFKTVMVVSAQRGLTIYFCIVTLMIR